MCVCVSLTISSTFMMLRTVSAASLIAEVETSRGCTTFSSRMSVMVPCNGGGWGVVKGGWWVVEGGGKWVYKCMRKVGWTF